jgi:8-oxo-dGTP pyrophosphatase MutT (NUDIX family)
MGKTKAAGVFIINKKNELLICHPTKHADNVWSIPKGKIEEGEDAKVAAIRETFEETNIQLPTDSILHELEVQSYKNGKKSLAGFIFFECENNLDLSTIPLQCNSNVPEEKGGFPEMDDFKWVNINEAIDLIHITQSASCEAINALL